MGHDATEYDTDQRAARMILSLYALSVLAYQTAETCAAALCQASSLCLHALTHGGTLYVCGNGGSAASAQHFAAELVGRFRRQRPGLAAVCLNTDTSALTAIANDFGYEQVFARQLEALGTTADVLIALSTSGTSPNILAALDMARRVGMPTILLTGERWVAAHKPVTCGLWVPSKETPRIQEIHDALLHAIAESLDEALYAPEA